jgi:hypothetical protein
VVSARRDYLPDRKPRPISPSRSTSGTAGDNVVEQLAGLDDYTMAVAAYWAAVEARPRDKITLRQGARMVVKNWKE